MNMIFGDIETFILDLNVGPTKKLSSGDLTIIKRCKSDYHLISPHNISPESLTKKWVKYSMSIEFCMGLEHYIVEP